MNEPPITYYCYRLRNDDFITEFCVTGDHDPQQYVETPAPDGTLQRWRKYHEGDLTVFVAPDGYAGGPMGWHYDNRLQQGEAMPHHLLERYALRMQVSAVMVGG